MQQRIVMATENIFIDTSAFYALMDSSDAHHEKAKNIWIFLLEEESHLHTTNYIMIESLALLQSRLGFEAAHLFARDISGLVEFCWIDKPQHSLAFELWLSLGRRKMSLVDCVSFITMRHYKIENTFAFDKHFEEQGFTILH
ncbi:MAG: PIN domain-containing protein [Desulfobacterales bacterium]|jgi:predicted nucleic acid-binding protein